MGERARRRAEAAVEALLEGVDDLRSRSVQLLEALIAALAPCCDATCGGPSWLAIDSALSHLHGAVVGLREAADSPQGVDLDQLRSALHDARAHLSAWIDTQEHDLDPQDRVQGLLQPRPLRGGPDPQ